MIGVLIKKITQAYEMGINIGMADSDKILAKKNEDVTSLEMQVELLTIANTKLTAEHEFLLFSYAQKVDESYDSICEIIELDKKIEHLVLQNKQISKQISKQQSSFQRKMNDQGEKTT